MRESEEVDLFYSKVLALIKIHSKEYPVMVWESLIL